MSLDLPDTVILQLLKKLVPEERLTGNDHFDRRVLPEEDEDGNEIFYHGSRDGLRGSKLGPYLYVAPHPMFATGYSDQAHNDREGYYDNDMAHKVFKVKVPKGRAEHFNQYTGDLDSSLAEAELDSDDIEYDKLLLRGENPFNYVIDDTDGLNLEEIEITPELIAAAEEYWQPKELYEKLKQQRNLLDGLQRKY
jgi:hypothetical protein